MPSVDLLSPGRIDGFDTRNRMFMAPMTRTAPSPAEVVDITGSACSIRSRARSFRTLRALPSLTEMGNSPLLWHCRSVRGHGARIRAIDT